jgi:hypothetical protein
MSRWVRTDCEILSHPLFKPEPFTEREAWLWLITRAAWKDTHHRVGAEMVSVPRGSLFVTLRELQTAWKWVSDKRVRSFLNMLEKNAMIGRGADAGKTHITICNYSKYQDAGQGEDEDMDATRTQAGRKQDALKIPIYQDTKDISSLRSDIARNENDEKKKQKRKTPMPDNFVPNEAGREKAKSVGMDRPAFLDQLDQFRSYHASKGNLMADWEAAWRTWCGNFKSFGQRSAPARASPKPTPQDQIAEFQRLMRGEDNGQPAFSGATHSGSGDDRRENLFLFPCISERNADHGSDEDLHRSSVLILDQSPVHGGG